MTELEVPQRSIEELERWSGEYASDSEHVRAIAGPVAVALLRELAGDMHQPWDALVLRRRAELIEGGFS